MICLADERTPNRPNNLWKEAWPGAKGQELKRGPLSDRLAPNKRKEE